MNNRQKYFINKNNIHILVPVYAGLGNLLLKTPFFKLLRDQYPDSTIDVITDSEFGTSFILGETELVDNIINLPRTSSLKTFLKFFYKASGKYDLIIIGFDAQIWKLYLGAAISKAKILIGHTQKLTDLRSIPRVFLQTLLLDKKVKVLDNRHEIDLYLDLLEVQERPKNIYKTIAPNSKKLSKDTESMLQKKGIKTANYILIQLSAANGQPTPKIWPKDYFQDLIEKFCQKQINIIVVGDENERKYSQDVLKKFDEKVLNLTGIIPLADVIYLIKNCNGIICHDSGLMHIANAFNTPLIAIFGPGNLIKNYPKSEKSNVARIPLPCSPCIGTFYSGFKSEKDALALCPYELACMRNIKPQMIWKIAELNFNMST